jgi:hypothetical protein
LRLLAVWYWAQAAYTGFWGVLKSFGNGVGNPHLSTHEDFSFMIFYVLLGVFLMSGARTLVWLAYGDDKKAELVGDGRGDAAMPPN